MKKLLLSFFVAIGATQVQNVQAQTPTWSEDIAPILYNNCTTCHHDGGLAPNSLMSYSQAVAQQFTIQEDINAGKMPPWPPDKSYRHFKDERQLTVSQLDKINAWVNGGTPEGNTANAPTPPVYMKGSSLANVDKTLKAATFTVPTITTDLYQCFVVPTGLTQDEYMTAIEVIPGDPTIVHHVLIYEDTSSTHDAAAKDAATMEPGYTNFGGPGVPKASLVGGWVPGTRPEEYPSGMGVQLHKGSDLVVQIHYPAGSSGKTDSTKINLKLKTGNLRAITIQPPLNHFFTIDRNLNIPANTIQTFHETYPIPDVIGYSGVSLVNVAPHAHLLCKNWLVYAVTPAPAYDTIPLIKIDNWDFHWQGFYTFQKLQFIPKGSMTYAYATYDNTAANPNNPSSPPKRVQVGESTTDEMMLVYFSYLIYQPGDENIILDSTILNPVNTDIKPVNAGDFISTPQLYDAMPNPANGETTLSYYLPQAADAELKVYDLNGRLVDEIKATGAFGVNQVKYNTGKLNAGNYLYSLTSSGYTKTKQLVITQ